MKLKISKSELLKGLTRVQTIVDKRPSMPILSNALLIAEEDGLYISATDLEISIESFLKASVFVPGRISVRARNLLEIVRELPEEEISVSQNENFKLEIKAQRSRFNVIGISAAEFPEFPSLRSLRNNQFVRMNGKVILSMLEKTLYAASTDEARYHLNGIFFEAFQENEHNKKIIRMVATDAHRLALVDQSGAVFEEGAFHLFENGKIVPRKGLNELKRILHETHEDFFLSIEGNMLFLRQDDFLLSMRMIESRYVDYRRIIPEKGQCSIRVEKESFLSSIKRVSLMSSDKSKSIILTIKPGVIQLSSHSSELGEAVEEIFVDYDGELIEVAFNSRYLIEAISTIEGQEITIEFKNRQSPAVIRSNIGEQHLCIIMPMRI